MGDLRRRLGRARRTLLTASLRSALREQRLDTLAARLAAAVPDLSDQYTGFAVEGDYLTTKVRGQHAFQMSLLERALSGSDRVSVIDIGDSSGTHLLYMRALYGERLTRSLSVNLDPAAVERIASKGLEAVHARAENLAGLGISADIGVCFEMLEHISDPIMFLHALAERGTIDRLVVTVPYVRASRAGLGHIRRGEIGPVGAERTHVFELSPEDWSLVVRHAGWAAEYEQVYLQYPRRRPLRVTGPLWRGIDFEGFYGMILRRDDTWSSIYSDW